MTNNHHTVIATGAAANASVFNSPLSQLDTSITTNATNIAATTAEVIAARAAYPNLDARLDALVMAGSNVSTLTNGVANAAQKVVTVDSTTGFLAGAPVAYTLVGGVIETNTIDTVDNLTQLTLDVNIGAGGIANDTFIMVVNLGAMVSTGTVVGATAQTQAFVYGAFAGTVADARYGMFHASEAIAAHAHYGFMDTSELNFPAPGVYGHASFADDITILGTQDQDHHHAFQTSMKMNGSGTLARMAGLHSIPDVSAGTVTSLEHVAIFDAIGAGTVTAQYGVKIGNLSKGTANWSIYTGTTPSYFGGNVGIGITTPVKPLHLGTPDEEIALKFTTAGTGHTAGDGLNIGLLNDKRAYILNFENSPLSFYTNAAERMRITETGLIGINTISPLKDLHLSTANNEVWQKFTTAATGETAGDGLNFGVAADSSVYLLNYENTPIHVYTNGAERITIAAGGNIGIGAPVPASRLDIDAGALTMKEMTAPSAPAANSVVIYAVENGGKTQLMALFPTGVAQQIAIEP